MPHPRRAVPGARLEFTLDASLKARLDALLRSPTTGKIPPRSYQTFFSDLLQEKLDSIERTRNDLAMD